MAQSKFGIILVLLLPILLCNAEDEIQTDDGPIQTFVPSQDAIIQAQTEAIKRIMQAKSLELGNLNLSDSVLLSKCQQLARGANEERKETETNEDIKKPETTEERGDQNKETVEIVTEKSEFETLESQSQIKEQTEVKNEEKLENHAQININTDVIQGTNQISFTGNQIQNGNEQIDGQNSIKNPNPAQISDKMDYIPHPDNTAHPQPQIITSPYGRTLYYIYHRFFPENLDQKLDQTTPSTTSTTTTTTQASNEPMYAEKMRFVLRMPYPKKEPLSGFPWEFDRFAYFPKSMQPDYVNAPLPYAPVYHMIRRLVVPSKTPGNYIVETNQ